MPWYDSIGCEPPAWKNEAMTIVVDCIMIVMAICCLIMTIYGTYRYVIDHKALQRTNSIKPSKPLYCAGLLFFVISSFTLLNALIYDVAYLVCPRLDDIEGPLYHALYFLQIFCLWIVLFLRIYYIFKNSTFELSKCVIRCYISAFIFSIVGTIPIYFMFQEEADSFITLPYVVLSAVFSSAILATFIRKLIQIFSKLGADELLLKTMVKNTILAIASISCTFLVIIVLITLYAKHNGFHQRHSVLEELLLELFILMDIVSNFVCVMLSYTFFDKKFQKVCGTLNDKIIDFTSKKISSSFGDEDNGKRQKGDTTFTVTSRQTTQTAIISMIEPTTTDRCNTINSDDIPMSPQIHQLESMDTLEIEKEMHQQSKKSNVASLMLTLSNRLSKKKSNSPPKHRNINSNNKDITITLIDDDNNNDTLNVKHPLHLTDRHSMIGSNKNKKKMLSLRDIKSSPVTSSCTTK